jgi:hypothetical protein
MSLPVAISGRPISIEQCPSPDSKRAPDAPSAPAETTLSPAPAYAQGMEADRGPARAGFVRSVAHAMTVSPLVKDVRACCDKVDRCVHYALNQEAKLWLEEARLLAGALPDADRPKAEREIGKLAAQLETGARVVQRGDNAMSYFNRVQRLLDELPAGTPIRVNLNETSNGRDHDCRVGRKTSTTALWGALSGGGRLVLSVSEPEIAFDRVLSIEVLTAEARLGQPLPKKDDAARLKLIEATDRLRSFKDDLKIAERNIAKPGYPDPAMHAEDAESALPSSGASIAYYAPRVAAAKAAATAPKEAVLERDPTQDYYAFAKSLGSFLRAECRTESSLEVNIPARVCPIAGTWRSGDTVVGTYRHAPHAGDAPSGIMVGDRWVATTDIGAVRVLGSEARRPARVSPPPPPAPPLAAAPAPAPAPPQAQALASKPKLPMRPPPRPAAPSLAPEPEPPVRKAVPKAVQKAEPLVAEDFLGADPDHLRLPCFGEHYRPLAGPPGTDVRLKLNSRLEVTDVWTKTVFGTELTSRSTVFRRSTEGLLIQSATPDGKVEVDTPEGRVRGSSFFFMTPGRYVVATGEGDQRTERVFTLTTNEPETFELEAVAKKTVTAPNGTVLNRQIRSAHEQRSTPDYNPRHAGNRSYPGQVRTTAVWDYVAGSAQGQDSTSHKIALEAESGRTPLPYT